MSLTDAERRMIGGSDIAALLGDSRWGTPLQLYARIVGPAQPEAQTAPQRRGTVLERAVLELYAAETGAVLLPGPKLTHPRLAYVRSSLDALAVPYGDGARVVDAKTVGPGERRHFGEPGTDQVRRDILYQMVTYMGVGLARGVVDVPKADVPVLGLSGADLTIFTIDFDAELYGLIEEAIERFWRDHVEPRRPPPITEPLGDMDAIGALYPRHEGEAKRWEELTEVDQQWVGLWLKARKERAVAAWAEEEAEVKVRMLLGATPSLLLPNELGGGRVDWKQNRSTPKTDWKAVAEDLRASVDVSLKAYTEIINSNTTTKEGARPLVVRQKEEGK